MGPWALLLPLVLALLWVMASIRIIREYQRGVTFFLQLLKFLYQIVKLGSRAVLDRSVDNAGGDADLPEAHER